VDYESLIMGKLISRKRLYCGEVGFVFHGAGRSNPCLALSIGRISYMKERKKDHILHQLFSFARYH
jgi:hypothetical protein